MNLKQKKIFDAGTSTPERISPERDDGDVGQSYDRVPRSSYAISEESVLPFTSNKIVGEKVHSSSYADGNVRPGTAG